jgi:phage terminase large subunit GpA-like protein
VPPQAYEVLELFVELLAVRVHLIEKSKERPQDMNEALGTLVYAAARIQVPQPVLVSFGSSPAATCGAKQGLTCAEPRRLLAGGSSVRHLQQVYKGG